MSIESLAISDFKRFIDRDNTLVTFTNLEGDVTTIKAKVNRIDARIDPQTGTQVYEPSLAISIPALSLTVFPILGWDIQCSDTTGQEVRAKVADIRIDRTIGFITVIGEFYTVEAVVEEE